MRLIKILFLSLQLVAALALAQDQIISYSHTFYSNNPDYSNNIEYTNGPSLVINGQPIPYSQNSMPTNTLWIQGPNQQVQHTQCSMLNQLRLIAYSTGGPAIMTEVYPDGHSFQNQYYFQPGYNEIVFAPDVPGRHTLGYEVYGQLSNVVIIDVVGEGQAGGQGQTGGDQEREFEVGPGESIQAAIDAANPGDTIWVKTGIYNEKLNIDKQIFLVGWDTTTECPPPAICEDKNPPVLNAIGIDDAITINADGVVLEGFKIDNSGNAGINVQSSNNIIHMVSLNNNKYGIYVRSSARNNIINESTFNDNMYGIYLDSSTENMINATVYERNRYSIYLKSSDHNTIFNNAMLNDTETSIYLGSSNNNKINMNVLWYNSNGLILSHSYYNTISENSFIDSKIYNAYDDGKNDWYNSYYVDGKKRWYGNYYAYCASIITEYDIYGRPYRVCKDAPWQGCMDNNNDEICDSSYNIPGGSNTDQYPLTYCMRCRTGAWGTKIKHHK